MFSLSHCRAFHAFLSIELDEDLIAHVLGLFIHKTAKVSRFYTRLTFVTSQ